MLKVLLILSFNLMKCKEKYANDTFDCIEESYKLINMENLCDLGEFNESRKMIFKYLRENLLLNKNSSNDFSTIFEFIIDTYIKMYNTFYGFDAYNVMDFDNSCQFLIPRTKLKFFEFDSDLNTLMDHSLHIFNYCLDKQQVSIINKYIEKLSVDISHKNIIKSILDVNIHDNNYRQISFMDLVYAVETIINNTEIKNTLKDNYWQIDKFLCIINHSSSSAYSSSFIIRISTLVHSKLNQKIYNENFMKYYDERKNLHTNILQKLHYCSKNIGKYTTSLSEIKNIQTFNSITEFIELFNYTKIIESSTITIEETSTSLNYKHKITTRSNNISNITNTISYISIDNDNMTNTNSLIDITSQSYKLYSIFNYTKTSLIYVESKTEYSKSLIFTLFFLIFILIFFGFLIFFGLLSIYRQNIKKSKSQLQFIRYDCEEIENKTTSNQGH